MSEQLKECPFCGVLDVDYCEDSSEGCIFVKCNNCGAHGPTWDFSQERALYSWNNGERKINE